MKWKKENFQFNIASIFHTLGFHYYLSDIKVIKRIEIMTNQQ